jgi:hypothetical protein
MHRAPTPLPDEHDPVKENDQPAPPGVPPPEEDPVPDHNPSVTRQEG